MGAGKGQLKDLMFLPDKLCKMPVGLFFQPIKTLLNGSTALWDRPGHLMGHPPLLPPFGYFLLMPEINELLLAHLGRPLSPLLGFQGVEMDLS